MQPNSTLRLARVVPGGEPYRSEQGTVYQPGISDQTVGALSIFLGMVKGARARFKAERRESRAAGKPGGGRVRV